MEFSVLGSGSGGNAVFVQSGKTAILIDAGFSGKQIAERLKRIGKNIEQVKAVFVTHEHNDHIAGAGVLSRKLKIPVFANAGTYRGCGRKLGKLFVREEFETGVKLIFEDLLIRSFPISHDTNDPVGFVVDDGRSSLGYLTDTGTITHLMATRLRACDGLVLEFNHDPDMLRTGPYPLELQQRVRSNEGHLANEDAARFLQQICHDKLKTVILAHLSETNNLPQLALQAARSATKHVAAGNMRIITAEQSKPLDVITLDTLF